MKTYRFTLTELILVCCTAALLCTAVFAAGTLAGGRDKQAQCAAAQANMWRGIRAYASDHGGFLPRAGLEPNERWLSEWRFSFDSKMNMLRELCNYIPTENFLCPAAPFNQEKIYRPVIQDEACSFEGNAMLLNRNNAEAMKIDAIPTPERILLLTDRGLTQIGLSLTARFAGNGKYRFGRNHWRAAERVHQDKLNVIMADGSAALLSESMISRDKSYGLNPDGTPMF